MFREKERLSGVGLTISLSRALLSLRGEKEEEEEEDDDDLRRSATGDEAEEEEQKSWYGNRFWTEQGGDTDATRDFSLSALISQRLRFCLFVPPPCVFLENVEWFFFSFFFFECAYVGKNTLDAVIVRRRLKIPILAPTEVGRANLPSRPGRPLDP